MTTIGQRLAAWRGIAPGFDFLRIFLAVAVVAWHVNAIVTGDLSQGRVSFVWTAGYSILAAFFTLSGFLIAGSAQRLSLGDFLINRGLRIVPALAVEIVLCAFILGPLVSALGAAAYFAEGGTWAYLTNIVGVINYHLPGVFEGHPTSIVNNTLWTVPHEIGCYLIMSLLVLTRGLRRPWLVLGLAVALLGVGLGLQAAGIGPEDRGGRRLLYVLFVGKAARLYVCFLLGIAAYLLRDRIVYSWRLFALCCVAVVLTSTVPMPAGINYPVVNLLLVLPLCYMTAFLGVTDIWLPSWLKRGDYSYGIYLYGWPIQQMLVEWFPGQRSLPWHFFVAMPLILMFAAFSWHAIERPILQLRKRFSFVAKVRLASPPVEAPTGAEASGQPAKA